MQKTIEDKLVSLSRVIFMLVLAYVPLHIFISTVIGTQIGGLAFWKVAKDIVMFIGFGLLLFASMQKPWFSKFMWRRTTTIIILYGLLTLILALFRDTDLDAEVLGIVYNLRFLVFFLYAGLLGFWVRPRDLFKSAVKTAMVSGMIVVLFGMFQYFVLPNDALSRIGFTKENGVFPVFFIDDKPNLERVMSTVRDPNSLGSYLIVLICLIGAYYASARGLQKKMLAIYGLGAVLCMYLTFSRSAWLGLILSLVIVALFGAKKHIAKRTAAIGAGIVAAVFLLAVTGLYMKRNSYFVQNVLFHADQSTVQEDPNELRVRFVKESLSQISREPLGSGPGTAGLASIRNDKQGVRLNENYYLQVATEVGILGLVLFLAILFYVIRALYEPSSMDRVFMLAAFGGLLFTNMLVHIWSNEAVAYTWWGLAGLLIGGVELKHFTTPNKTRV